MRKKICIFADFPIGALKEVEAGRGGGQAATWLPQLAKSWDTQSEFDIQWVVLDRSAERSSKLRQWGQTFHQLPHRGISAGMVLARWPERIAYRRVLREVQPHLIQCWGTENLNGAALAEFKGPSILSMQGIIHTLHKTGDLKGWRWKLFLHWERSSIHKATWVTSESQWGIDQVLALEPGKQTHKVEYGVAPSYYDVSWQPMADQPRILFVGGWNRYKGVDILLEMLKRHPRRPWKMIFAGGGYLSDALRNLNDPSVEILGMLKTPEVQAEMAKAWALVHPSRADTSPNVVKEARVIGLPVVGSPHGGHAEYIEHGRDGLIVDSEDPEEWFKAINILCGDLELCRTMGTARHAWFREYFRPERTAEAFLELYREMLH